MRRNKPNIPRDYLYEPYGPAHPLARTIGEGTPWFTAWVFQYALNYPRLKKATGICPDRANALERGAPITRPELEALAKACGVQPSDVIASMPDPASMMEGG